MKWLLLLCCMFGWLALTACLPLVTPLPPLPSNTPGPPSETPTPTIVWFPPTATFTPLPTATLSLTPTLDTRPLYGALLWRDVFDDPAGWTTGRLPAGSLALGKNELSLAANGSQRTFLTSQRQNTILNDFYLEISASPSICRGADEYGLLVRTTSAPSFFRFVLTCDGRGRVDRVLEGQASSPQPLALNGAIPPGAPSSSRLGVWASGKDLRFYANGQYLFSVRDPGILSGGLGVFVRPAGPDAMTVNFSALSVYEVAR